jgi:hypothetical protein
MGNELKFKIKPSGTFELSSYFSACNCQAVGASLEESI